MLACLLYVSVYVGLCISLYVYILFVRAMHVYASVRVCVPAPLFHLHTSLALMTEGHGVTGLTRGHKLHALLS